MTLTDLKSSWQDTPEYHKHIHELFCENVNNDEQLNAHRTWSETNIWGFGERSFHYLWKILLTELPENSKILEIGCFRGQTLSLFKILRPDATIFGITPLDTTGGMWESDYAADIKRIHDEFNIENPVLFVGKSQDEVIINQSFNRYNLVYIDGLHTFDGCYNDLINYCKMIPKDGFLALDDCNTEMKMWWGAFQGILEVTEAKQQWLKEFGNDWEFICSVVHISIFKRK